MELYLDAACACGRGRVRKNNEDNFLFNSRYLPEENDGLGAPITMRRALREDLCLAVFDGMGGENFGETAAFAAAQCLYRQTEGKKSFFVPDMESVTEMVEEMNRAVVAEAEALRTEHMGTTLAALFFHRGCAYVCNLGDSRGYRLRGREMEQITVDHLQRRGGLPSRKLPLSQYLGISPDVLQLTPHIAKGELERGDRFLLCSDGLTDMLSDEEIRTIWRGAADPGLCVHALTAAAMGRGGWDNITVITCAIG